MWQDSSNEAIALTELPRLMVPDSFNHLIEILKTEEDHLNIKIVGSSIICNACIK